MFVCQEKLPPGNVEFHEHGYAALHGEFVWSVKGVNAYAPGSTLSLAWRALSPLTSEYASELLLNSVVALN